MGAPELLDPSLEEQKKGVLPFLTRAQEIEASEPRVAYYTRLYAVDQAMKFPHRAKEVTDLMMATFSKLEQDKRQLSLDPENDRWYCEAFATRVFNNADHADRAGRADLNTAKAFYASVYFFAMLAQFGDVQPDVAQKQRYASWRAAEIRQAVREGRPPVPPPAGRDASDAMSDAALVDELDAMSAAPDTSASAGSLLPTPANFAGDASMAEQPNIPTATSSFGGTDVAPQVASSAPVASTSAGETSTSAGEPGAAPPWLHLTTPAQEGHGSGGGDSEKLDSEALPSPPPVPPSNASLSMVHYGPGTRVMVRLEDGSWQQGTVQHILRAADGERRPIEEDTWGSRSGWHRSRIPPRHPGYKVALADRFILVAEGDLAPLHPGGGGGGGGGHPPATPSSRPGNYLVRTMDGSLQPDERNFSRYDQDERRVTSKIIPPSIVEILPPPSWPTRPAPTIDALQSTEDTTSHQHPSSSMNQPFSPPSPNAPPPIRTVADAVLAALEMSRRKAQQQQQRQQQELHELQQLQQEQQQLLQEQLQLQQQQQHEQQQTQHQSQPPPALVAAQQPPPLMPQATATASSPAAAGVAPAAVGAYYPSLTTITVAQKLAKHAVSSLSFEDVTTAIKCLQDALKLLTQP